MEIINEIEFYCANPCPVGALLLTGEWGCGKTYFIEHDLKDQLSSKVVMVKVSLFGMTLTNEIHKAVKNTYLNTLADKKIHGDFSKYCKKGKEILDGISSILPENAGKWLNIDLSEAIPLSNKIDCNGISKTVLLVFDDLERCNINASDILGIINDYCENKGFHTLIVANQEKISSRSYCKSDNLQYDEIKEKIVQRTITYIPDYKKIVASVVENVKCGSTEYSDFLKKYTNEIYDLFSAEYTFVPGKDDQNKDTPQPSRPHNIRSLKCALNDFFRVYELLSSYEINYPELWLFNFISYMIAYKGNMIHQGCYGSLFTDVEVQKIFPAYQSRYMVDGIQKWILDGVWDEENITHELESIKQRDKPMKACDKLKTFFIYDVDENIVNEGFEEYLENAYSGKFTLDEYILMIENSAWARNSNYTYPKIIDWEKVKSGISSKISKIMKAPPDCQVYHMIISSENRKYFLAPELEAYDIIEKEASTDKLMLWKNKQQYIKAMHSSPYEGLIKAQSRRFDRFDEDMANATYTAFENASTDTKRQFPNSFFKLWLSHINGLDINKEVTKRGFLRLKELLQKYVQQHASGKRTFAIIHSESFETKVDDLIKQLEKDF